MKSKELEKKLVSLHGKIGDFRIKAKEIRREYLNYTKNIKLDEEKLRKYKDEINELLKNGDEINENYENKNSELYKREMSKVVDELDEKVKAVQNNLKPYRKKINQLEKQSDILYDTIREKYPNLSKEEIQRQIKEQLEE